MLVIAVSHPQTLHRIVVLFAMIRFWIKNIRHLIYSVSSGKLPTEKPLKGGCSAKGALTPEKAFNISIFNFTRITRRCAEVSKIIGAHKFFLAEIEKDEKRVRSFSYAPVEEDCRNSLSVEDDDIPF